MVMSGNGDELELVELLSESVRAHTSARLMEAAPGVRLDFESKTLQFSGAPAVSPASCQTGHGIPI
jgi:hypothetical protein